MNDVDDLFNDLKSGEKKPKPVPNHQNRSASNGIDVSSYASKIQMAIRNSVPQWESYRGQMCTIRVNLNRDAVLMGSRSEGGDPAFCTAMLEALKTVKFPKFPDDDHYNVFKNVALDFKP